MKQWLQRLRGALGMGLTWAAAWVPVGAVAGLLAGVVFDLSPVVAQVAGNYAILFGVLGFVGGTIFSTVVSMTEGRRRFSELSLPRFVAWGALGGLVLGGLAITASLLGSGFTALGAAVVGVTTLLGAGSAAGTLVIARSADRQSLVENDADTRLGRPDTTHSLT